MGTVTITGALESEATAKANGWTEEQLLDLAGTQLGAAVARFFPRPGMAIGYLGKGHNAADVLVALRVLRDRYGWETGVRASGPLEDAAPLTRKKWRQLGSPAPLPAPPATGTLTGPLVLLDGLVGTGAAGPLRGPSAGLATEMNSLRQTAGARVAAVDVPSGIDADTGEIFPGAVLADITFMIGNAKCGLLHGHAAKGVGALAVVPVEPLTVSRSVGMELITPQHFDFGKPPRPFDFHKGNAGRVAILAGSVHYTGAAVLAASGALRGGAGLITLFVPASCLAAVSAKCPPEIIVRGYDSPLEILETRFDALVMGCGMGEMDGPQTAAVLALIAASPAPAVIDADALNLLARTGKTGILSHRHVLTPHPGEFARLAPDLKDLPREEACRLFSARTDGTLLLKGSRTIISTRDEPLRVNSTGTPAMASGGQGDLLAGVIGARLASGSSPIDSASLSAWICGRAAEIALNEPGLSEESLTASDVLRFLGAAFEDWRKSRR